MILQEEYNLNLESQLSKKYVKVSQYDTGRRLLITLLKNDCSMFKIPSEASASINGLKPDGKGFRYDCSIENNKVVVDMKEQMTVLAGYVKCEILLSKGGERIATANFMLSVEESPLSENTPISSTDIPLLQKAIEASEIVLSVEKTVKGYSESASKSSQSAQKSAESASNASASSAESARNSSQSAQASAESANSASQSATNAQESAESAIQTKAEVEQLKKETVEQTKTLTDSAKQEISTVKDATVSEVTQLKTDTISDITSIKDRAVEEVTVIKDDAKAEADKAKESETNAKLSETNASNSAKEAKASAASVANVVSDVSKLKEDTAALQKRQNVLIGSETGNPISCDDAFAAPLCGLHIYGKSTQNGTPTPDAPVPIVSAGDGGSVAVKVTGKNLIRGINRILAPSEVIEGGVRIVNIDGGNSRLAFFAVELKKGVQYTIRYNGKLVQGTDIKTRMYLPEISQHISNTFIPKQDVDIIGIYLDATDIGTVEVTDIQLELGSTATAYSPYREQLLTMPTPNGLLGIPVSSGGNYTDSTGQQWVCDEVDLEREVKVQRVKVLDINNTSLMLKPSSNSYWYVSRVLSDCGLNNTGTTSYKAVMCQKFPVVSQSDETKYSYPIVAPYGHIDKVELRFRAPEALYATIEDFRQTIVGTKVYYPLATPR